MTKTYKTSDTCSTQITFDKADDGTITNISFTGGCNGNLKAISKAMEGKSAQEIYDLFKDIKCGRRPTSCAEQLALAVISA